MHVIMGWCGYRARAEFLSQSALVQDLVVSQQDAQRLVLRPSRCYSACERLVQWFSKLFHINP